MTDQKKIAAVTAVLTSCAAASISHSAGYTQADFDAKKNACIMRENYETAFTLDDPKKILLDVGKGILEELKKTIPESKDAKVDFSDYNIGHGDQLYPVAGHDVITAGRMFSDITFTQPACSRLHALIFPLPTYGIVAVVDVGSYRGIQTIMRSSNLKCESSDMETRRTLIFKHDESALLIMGSQFISLNPKMCIICMEKARSQKFDCGHTIACAGCASQIVKCPICRTEITAKKTVAFVVKSHDVAKV